MENNTHAHQEVTILELDEIIETRRPLGLFLHNNLIVLLLDNSSRQTYTAVDNSTGDAWTEEFDIKEDAINWLVNKYITHGGY